MYKETDKSKGITLNSKIILQVIDDIKSKLTKKEVEIYANFHEDLSANKVNAFNKRMKNLKKELKEFYGDDDDKPRPIGFRVPNV